jgi:hypothetical protein
VAALPVEWLIPFVARVAQSRPALADVFLEAGWERYVESGRTFELAIVATSVASRLEMVRTLQWCVRFMKLGIHPTVAVFLAAADVRQLPSERIRAAAAALRVFGIAEGASHAANAARRLEDPERRAAMRAELESFAPSLLVDFDGAVCSPSCDEPARPSTAPTNGRPPPRGLPVCQASIIIAVHEQPDQENRCLQFLNEVTAPRDFEVILADSPLGFTQACNLAAVRAKGRVLVFLSADAEPHHGWLSALLEVFDTDPEVGIVGSRLYFGDGIVRHAGLDVAEVD